MTRISGAALALLLAAGLSISGCGCAGRKAGAVGNPDAKVRIRLHNLDSIALTDVHVHWPVDSARFDSLPSQAYTDYIAVDSAYRYAYVKAKAGKRVWICLPMDFVGETPLAPGRYTYDISPAAVADMKDEKSMGFLRMELSVDKEHP